ncbi:glutaredoxin family protein [Halalkalibacillus halophilus]|uniref:glutaredoxin family protein n=1 Tax=Halalkalibacillus halophilus TaxID=392827 RepID=UPI00040D20FB|nr:glutaredoxin family protein [Halalkalibacillus halophilus]
MSAKRKKVIYFYTKNNCKLCEEAKQILEVFQRDYGFDIMEQNIYHHEKLLEQYFLTIPVIRVNDQELTAEKLSFATVDEFLREQLT